MKQRVITGSIIVVIACTLLSLSETVWFFKAVVALLTVGAIYEIHRISSVSMNWRSFLLFALLAVAVSYMSVRYYPAVCAVAFILFATLFGCLIFRTEKKKSNNLTPVFTAALSMMVILFFHCAVKIRYSANGFLYLLFAVLVCTLTDTFAYFIGTAFGKTKLAPMTSPKKTIVGSVGGTAVSAAALLILARVYSHSADVGINWFALVITTIAVSIIGQFGDLSMSAVKRMAHVKDFGNLMPGHGGILDRFDSMLFTLPFVYLLCQFGFGFIK